MRDDPDSTQQGDSGTASLDNLSEAQIRKSLRSAALQTPATIIPFGISVLCVVYLLLFAASAIPPLLVFIVLLGALLTASGSFLWTYSIRHDKEYAKLVQRIIENQGQEDREVQEAALTELRETLKKGFSSFDSAAGLKALTDLDHEFEQLQLALERQDESGTVSMSQLPRLAGETYNQGLNVLANGLRLLEVIHASGRRGLETEIAELEVEIESLKKDEAETRRVALREETVASHRNRLELIDQQQYRVDELFHQCDRCEASLATTRIELAGLEAGASGTSVNAVTDTLQRTIDQAKEVQDELKRLGF